MSAVLTPVPTVNLQIYDASTGTWIAATALQLTPGVSFRCTENPAQVFQVAGTPEVLGIPITVVAT